MATTFRTLILHLLGCLAFLSIPILSSPDFNTGANLFTITPFVQSFIRTVLLLLFFYLNYYILLPKLFFINKKTVYYLVIILCFFVIYLAPNWIIQLHFFPKTNASIHFPIKKRNVFHFFESSLFQFIVVWAISYLLKIKKRIEIIKQEKQLAEITNLKSQINPHFLFNTLNSIYALTLIKSDKAPDAVLKLSNMMRYVVTENHENFVPLSKELNYISNYIDLQKLRINNNVKFSYNVNGSFENKEIAPLILITFIENAFKYGLNPDEESEIVINISVKNQTLSLKVQNKIVVHFTENDLKSEIGIENTKKRLAFLYPNKHMLSVENTQNMYTVLLTINLTKIKI